MPEHSLSAVPACASQADTQTGLRRRQAMAGRQKSIAKNETISKRPLDGAVFSLNGKTLS